MDNAEEVVVLEVDGTLIGIPVGAVASIVRAVAITPVPGAPPGMDGVIDVHGVIVPVVDARARLGMGAAPVSPSQVLALLRVDGRLAGVRVDGVRGLQELRPGEQGALARAGDWLVLRPSLGALLGDAFTVLADAGA